MNQRDPVRVCGSRDQRRPTQWRTRRKEMVVDPTYPVVVGSSCAAMAKLCKTGNVKQRTVEERSDC